MEAIDVTLLSSKGQIVIPSAARACLRLKPGARFLLYTDGTSIVLRPIGPRDYAAFRKTIAKTRATHGKPIKEKHP
ncbi:MAG: AbrB/MazE/SpoVT family DNA-binding domain-containing protein [Kiritimatiellae bacterium]|nr:AbrB/MazE/SpoVT family DNA-binding domain-containing protein [Kiritimatiellia bacterium]